MEKSQNMDVGCSTFLLFFFLFLVFFFDVYCIFHFCIFDRDAIWIIYRWIYGIFVGSNFNYSFLHLFIPSIFCDEYCIFVICLTYRR